MNDRDFAIHRAKVYLMEARNRRRDTSFHAVLLRWAAANARQEAMAARPQLDLFGASA